VCCVVQSGTPLFEKLVALFQRWPAPFAGALLLRVTPSIFQMNRLNRSSSYGLTSLMIDALDDVPFWPNVRKPITNTKLNAKLFAGERTKS
jgi:hypothetical protein